MKSIRLLNIDVLDIPIDVLLRELSHGVLYTPNVDHFVRLQEDKEFYDSCQKANYIVCDSQIVQLFSYLPGVSRLKNVIPGSSFFPAYYTYHRENPNVKMFLLGAAEGVADEARRRINKKVGREIVVGAHSPSFGFEKVEEECEDIIRIIDESGANVLVVGVGAPKQEKWIAKYKDRFSSIQLFMGLGATIDFEAGNVKRAPQIFQTCRLEWLFRLYANPKRLVKRYLVDDLPIFYYFFLQMIGKYRNPWCDNSGKI